MSPAQPRRSPDPVSAGEIAADGVPEQPPRPAAEPAVPRRWHPGPLLGASAAFHAAVLGAVATAPGRWPLAAAALAGNHLVIAGTGLLPASRLLGPNLSRLPAAAARRGEVGITFDDGPDPRVTPAVLARLAEHGATASFFAIGQRAERYPELVAEVARRGHRVENHSYSHPHTFSFYFAPALRREIGRAQEILARAAGRQPSFFRAPAGLRNFLLEPVLAAAGLHLASWSRRAFDTVSHDPRQVVRRLLRSLVPGDVLLLHDGSTARSLAGVPVVLEALPRLLDALAERGLRAVALAPPGPGTP
jgi:peptidoglycan/xylan/chitin deacetylase (PgdA/CDA1 family)